MGQFPTVFDLHDVPGELAPVPVEIRGALAGTADPGAPIVAVTWKRDPRTRVL